MGREHGDDAQARESLGDLVPGHTTLGEVAKDGFEAAGLGLGALACPAPLAPYAMNLLCHVHETEVAREGAREFLGGAGAETRKLAFECDESLGISRTPRACGVPRGLDLVEDLDARFLSENLSQQRSEIAHVPA
jgi:hypothetical protein